MKVYKVSENLCRQSFKSSIAHTNSAPGVTFKVTILTYCGCRRLNPKQIEALTYQLSLIAQRLNQVARSIMYSGVTYIHVETRASQRRHDHRVDYFCISNAYVAKLRVYQSAGSEREAASCSESVPRWLSLA